MKGLIIKRFFGGIIIIAILVLSKPFFAKIYAKTTQYLEEKIYPLYFVITRAEASIKKSKDFMHLFYWFQKTKLPIYKLYIGAEDIRIMNNSVENGRINTKIAVPTYFISDDYNIEAKIRYRGKRKFHWENAKRSLLIKFPKDQLFQKMKAMDLIIPISRSYVAEITNNNFLKQIGLMSNNMFFIWLKINNKDAGVYLAKERYSSEWLGKNAISPDSEIFTLSLTPPFEWIRDINEANNSFMEIKTFLALFKKSDEEFKKNIGNILDLQKWYRAIAMNIFVAGEHSMNGATGKLEPLLEDISLNNIQHHNGDPQKAYIGFPLIIKRILSDQNFYKEYIKILKEIITDANFKTYLLLYDNFYREMKSEFYRDKTKYYSDNDVDNKIEDYRKQAIENYKTAQKLTTTEELPIFDDIEILKKEAIDFSGKEFPNFYDISKTGEEFIEKHPQFFLSGKNLILKTGIYSFYENIIVPTGLKLIIEPGTHLFLGEGISIVSYSPVKAIGSADKPIILERLYPQKTWGSFAMINTDDANEFKHIKIDGGSSSEKINGVIFTGMLSAHNAPLYVSNSEFSNDNDDDAINVKQTTGVIENSLFTNTAGDAIDLDITNDFSVRNNRFFNIGTNEKSIDGGDAIDISFSSAIIDSNKIEQCGDKGISIGEKSKSKALKNIITGCDIGIAVKDASEAFLEKNAIANNNVGVALYQKKEIFGGARAILRENVFENNKIDTEKDKESIIQE